MRSIISIPGRPLESARHLSLFLWPHGGQATARANAFASMVDDRHKARDRAEADTSMRASHASMGPRAVGHW
jgi:hypothetical protein